MDRGFAVGSPLHYTTNSSKRRAAMLIALLWILAIALSTPILFGVPELNYDSCAMKSPTASEIKTGSLLYILSVCLFGFVIPLIILAYLYFVMFKAAQTNKASLGRNSCSSCLSSDVVVNVRQTKHMKYMPEEGDYRLRRNYSSETAMPKKRYFLFVYRHKAAVTGLLVLVSFIVCYSPFFAMMVVEQFQEVTLEVKFLTNLFTLLSSIFNPYVYFYRNKSTWSLTKKLVSRLCGRNSRRVRNHVARRNSRHIKTVYQLPCSLTQTVLAGQIPSEKSLSNHSKSDDKSEDDDDGNKKDAVFSMEPLKQLVHQSSTSSNDSSDAYATTLSTDADAAQYQLFHQRLSEDSTFEIPL